MATAKSKTTKPKAEPIVEVADDTPPEVVVTVDEAPSEEPTVEPVTEEAQPEVFVLFELHEREDGWWVGGVTFPGGDCQSFHAPRRAGVEAAAHRLIAVRAPELPLVIKVV
jgi:hypothetical protein